MSSAKRFAAGRIRPGSRGHSARSNAALRLLLLLVGLTVTVACGGSAPSLHFQRATVDRPDELEGPQIHFVYAVPAGRKELDRDWDENGAPRLLDRHDAHVAPTPEGSAFAPHRHLSGRSGHHLRPAAQERLRVQAGRPAKAGFRPRAPRPPRSRQALRGLLPGHHFLAPRKTSADSARAARVRSRSSS